MLLVFRPFKVGDRIEIGDVKGRVSEIGLFTTAIDTTDRRRQILPNSMVNTSVIENHSHHPTRRVDVTIYFAADCAPEEIRTLLTELGLRFNRPEVRPQADIVVKRLHPWGSEWELRLFVPMIEHNDVLYATHEAVLQGMAARGLHPPAEYLTRSSRLTSS
jgi:small conductance mechanosensitive channel